MSEITLPWLDKALSPNARVHWSVKAKAAKQARKDGCYATLAAGFNKATFAGYDGRIHLWVDFYRPSKREHDHDNLVASIKHQADGIADALGVNDSRFRYHPFIKDETAKGGKIVIRLTTGPEGMLEK
jgi:hypothetical protein